GSQRSSASRMSTSIFASVEASMFAKTWLWIPQPNSGRIGRSPGAVPRMTSIASCTSGSPVESASPPSRSTLSGNAIPVAMMSLIGRRSSEADLGSRDRDHAGGAEADLGRAALELEVRRALDRDRRAALDRHRLGAVDGHVALRLLVDLP